VQQSVPGRLRHLVQLHLSRDCNHPDLARQTAQEVLGRLGADVEVHTASQDHPVPTLDLRGANGRAAKYAQRSRKKRAPACRTTFLPGMGDAVATAATAG
jgi:hypothetical protein